MASSPRELFRRFAARVAGPALEPHIRPLEARLARIEELMELVAGATVDRDKHREELAYWRWLIKTDQGRKSLHGPVEQVFMGWQRQRLRELGTALGLDGDRALDDWCAMNSAVEIGSGPFPALGAAPRWNRAIAVDPIAKAYVEEGLVPASAGHVTYLESPGERIPLPAGSADLVIIENALDHVSDPAAVLNEIRRLLTPRGLLWLLVDLSEYSDHMHPHPFNEQRVRGLLASAGFEALSDRVSDHKSHPKAYGEYRGLLKKMSQPAPPLASAIESEPSGAATPM